jgi:hypothetical protein
MSKKQFKSQASSSRVVLGTGAGTGFGGFGSSSSGSTLSYLDIPPDFSSISDSNVVVAFKNLLKKDSTTKAKGLEDLRTYVQAHPYEQGGGVEQAILDVWVGLLCWMIFQCIVIVINSIGQTVPSDLNRQFASSP